MEDWAEHERREAARYADGLARLPDEPGARGRQLVRMANAACGAGLACLAAGQPEEARSWLRRAAERYRESYDFAPPESWGRLVAVVKMRLLADGPAGASADARWALAEGPAQASSPIGRYAAVLALLALGDDEPASALAQSLQDEPDGTFPRPVADALAALAAGDTASYRDALERTLRSFEERDAHLEGVPVADTVLALEALAEPRGLAAHPASPGLPAAPAGPSAGSS